MSVVVIVETTSSGIMIARQTMGNGYIRLVVIVLILLGVLFVFNLMDLKVDNEGTLEKKDDLTPGSFFTSTLDWNEMLSFLPYGLPVCGEINTAVSSEIDFNLTKVYL